RERMTKSDRPVSQKEAAYAVMVEAYEKAAGSVGKANPRQIYYAARGPIFEATGKEISAKYFCQTLLVDYMAEHPGVTADWDIIWDNRGHFRESHNNHEI